MRAKYGMARVNRSICAAGVITPRWNIVAIREEISGARNCTGRAAAMANPLALDARTRYPGIVRDEDRRGRRSSRTTFNQPDNRAEIIGRKFMVQGSTPILESIVTHRLRGGVPRRWLMGDRAWGQTGNGALAGRNIHTIASGSSATRRCRSARLTFTGARKVGARRLSRRRADLGIVRDTLMSRRGSKGLITSPSTRRAVTFKCPRRQPGHRHRLARAAIMAKWFCLPGW